MGVVYLAFREPGQPVALKVLRPELGDDPDFRARFRQEVDAARRVSEQHTAKVLDADPEASPPWLATAYVPGPSLQEAVTAHGPLPLQTALPLVIGVAEALTAIHAAGVVHRDLKPSNVLLAPDGPRLIDFGIARAVEAAPVTRTGTRLGSPQYMAPEQARGDAVTPAVDVWALGALACFAATGRSPFGEGGEAAVLYRVMQSDPDLGGCPAELTGVIWACLAKAPAERPSLSQVTEWCRAEAAVVAAPGGSWLPPVLAAGLSGYAAPSAATAPTSPVPGQPGPAPAAPPVTGQPGPAPAAPPVPPLPAAALGAPAPGARPSPHGAQPYAASRPDAPTDVGHPAAAVPPRSGGRRMSPWAVAASAAAAAVLVGLAGYGVVALVSNRGHTSNNHVAGGHGPSRSPSPTAAASKKPSPSPSSTLDQCLIGTWRQTLEQFPDTLDGVPVTFSGGAGVIQVFSPAGVNTLQYSNATYTAQENGNTWSQVDNGTATVNYTTQDGMLLSSDLVQSGTWTLYENGSYSNGGPLSENIAPDRYTCSGNSLQLFAPNGDSIDLTRSS
jgi:serine/threonine kinase PknH